MNDPKIPPRTRTFWKNINATSSDKRKWVNIFNSCAAKTPDDDQRCFMIATGTVSRDIKKRRGERMSMTEEIASSDINIEILGEETCDSGEATE